jgi:methyl-accepting chemotaxis protein
MKLQIRQRLIALVVVALAVLACVGVFAYKQTDALNALLQQAIGRHAQTLQAVDQARSAQVHFKIQVQEWKNILLRGRDPESFAKYRKGFDEQEAQVQAQLQQLSQTISALDLQERIHVDQVAATFAKLGPAYREALKQYDRNTADPAANVDKLVRGIDREPTQAIDGLVRDIEAVAQELNTTEANNANALYMAARIGLLAFSAGAVAILSAIAFYIVRSITIPLSELEQTMHNITTHGDLTHRASVVGDDEIGRMASAFNAMIAHMQTLIGEVRSSSDRIASSATQLADSSQSLTEVAEQQANAVAGSAAAIEELTVAIASVSDTGQDVQSRAGESVAKTMEGNRQVSHLVEEIERIGTIMHEIAGKVGDFVSNTQAITCMTQEVRELADQTNLLALNAAIEAARAGEAGRGFAVVADEVRKLAERSAHSASEIDRVTRSITAQSGEVQKAISHGEQVIASSSELAVSVEQVLSDARDAVQASSRGVTDIGSSVAEQKLASTEIAQNMERIAHMSDEAHAATRNVSDASADLRTLAGRLLTSVAGFRAA